jgi:prolyl oligopeptidase
VTDPPTRPAPQFLDRLTTLFNYEKFTCPIKRGSRYFYSHNSGRWAPPPAVNAHGGVLALTPHMCHASYPGLQAQYVLYKQSALDAPGEVLLDPNTLSQDGTVSLSTYAITDDGELLAYGISQVRTHSWPRTTWLRD